MKGLVTAVTVVADVICLTPAGSLGPRGEGQHCHGFTTNQGSRLLAGCVVLGAASVSFAATADAGTGARAHLYKGYAFDACAAPSLRALRAWRASPFRALNIYIGGGDRASAQPNLSASWVRAVLGMGWRLIPTYVSLQAPHPSCPCASMNPWRANSEGVAAATNAVHAAEKLGIGRGNPIYEKIGHAGRDELPAPSGGGIAAPDLLPQGRSAVRTGSKASPAGGRCHFGATRPRPSKALVRSDRRWA